MANSNKSTFFFRITELQTLYLSFTAIFLCTGFFYNFIFFRLFGIRAELFFSFQDYLSSSIEKVYLIVVAILLASGGSHVIRYLLHNQKAILRHRLLKDGGDPYDNPPFSFVSLFRCNSIEFSYI